MGELFLAAASENGKDAEGREKSIRERLKDFLPPAPPDGQSGPHDDADADDDDDDDDDLEEMHTTAPADVAGLSASREELSSMSVQDLKAVMAAHGLSPVGMLEKQEFVDAICAHVG